MLTFHEKCRFFKPIFCRNVELRAVQKDAHLVELAKCCQTHIFLQKFVLIQPRTSPPKCCKICKMLQHFAKLANFAKCANQRGGGNLLAARLPLLRVHHAGRRGDPHGRGGRRPLGPPDKPLKD